MQLSGKLPQNVAIDLTDVSDTTKQTSSGNSSCTHLSKEQLSQLDLYYMMVDSNYRTACMKVRKKRANQSCRLKDFPTLSSWVPESTHVLSASQLDLCKGPSDSISSLPVLFMQDEHGRKIKYSTLRSDDPTSTIASSYVALHLHNSAGVSSGDVVNGQIHMLFKHQFNKTEHILAYVYWFKKFERDIESGLYTATLNSYCDCCKVVSLSDLSRPLIHAIDCHDPNMLWLLNFKQSY